MRRLTAFLLMLLPFFYLQIHPVYAQLSFNYTKTVIQSLGDVKQAQEIAESHQYSQFIPSRFVKAQMDVDKALQKISDAKVEVHRYYATRDDYIRTSVGYLLGGFTRMQEVIEEIKVLMQGKLDNPLEVKDTDLFLQLEAKFDELAKAKDYFYQGSVLAAHAMIDRSKMTEQGATHLKLTRTQKEKLDKIINKYLDPNQKEPVRFESHPAKAAIAVISDFLNQSWAMNGETVSEEKPKVELFNDKQLGKINYQTDQIQHMDEVNVYHRKLDKAANS